MPYGSTVGTLAHNASSVPPTDVDIKQRIIDLVAASSTEVTPVSANKIQDFQEHLPTGTKVYITFLPGADYKDTVSLAERLRNEGFEPVPHIAARSITDRKQLEDYLDRSTSEAGVQQVLAIAGALNRPCGEYSNSMQLLETGLFDKYGITRVGVAGHPENCPDCTEDAVISALKWKASFAERSDAEFHIVTQFCFEAAPFISWEARLKDEGINLPIHAGIPGLASIKTLINFAVACGVGNSINFIKRQSQNVSKLLKPQTPDKLLLDIATHIEACPDSNFTGLHFFPLGGLKKTAAWTQAIMRGDFKLNVDSDGFTVRT